MLRRRAVVSDLLKTFTHLAALLHNADGVAHHNVAAQTLVGLLVHAEALSDEAVTCKHSYPSDVPTGRGWIANAITWDEHKNHRWRSNTYWDEGLHVEPRAAYSDTHF